MRIVHYINQFFAGVGGEDSADTPPGRADGAVGPGRRLAGLLGDDHQVVATVWCGDDHGAGNPDAVSRILAYLVDNAIRFSPDGGRVELRVLSSVRGTRFVVRDEGIGVPESERERIFEKFHRAQSAVARGIAGTGLGLYVAAELARELGGRITLEAAPGAGSIFALELPAD